MFFERRTMQSALSFLCVHLASPATAATMRTLDEPDRLEVTPPSFADLIIALPAPNPGHVLQTGVTEAGPASLMHFCVLCLYAGYLAAILPPLRRPPALLQSHCARALAAISWILCTIARKPLERCADKWSFKPRRPSSSSALTPNTSSTVRPS